MKIKTCGLFREEDINYANKLKPNYIGFVFAESKRKRFRGRKTDRKRRFLSEKRRFRMVSDTCGRTDDSTIF